MRYRIALHQSDDGFSLSVPALPTDKAALSLRSRQKIRA
jgi:hypothetical protein